MDHRREVAEAAGPGLFDLMRVGIGYLACELELGFIFSKSGQGTAQKMLRQEHIMATMANLATKVFACCTHLQKFARQSRS